MVLIYEFSQVQCMYHVMCNADIVLQYTVALVFVKDSLLKTTLASALKVIEGESFTGGQSFQNRYQIKIPGA